MTESRKRVECGQHGTRNATFVCRHLATESGAGFHWGVDDDEPDALWPDAWCDACEAVRRSEDGWTDRSEEFAGVRLLCDGCYEGARARNWKQDDEAFDALQAEAAAYLHERQDRLRSEFALGTYSRYDWNQDAGRIVFSGGGRPQLVADVQFAGSISSRSGSWLWSWANPSIVEPVRREVRRVRAFGEERRFLKLAAARWSATEADGWDMTAIAAYLLGASGAYRSPDERGATFLVLTSVGWAH